MKKQKAQKAKVTKAKSKLPLKSKAKIERPTILVNFKVNAKTLKALNLQADKLAKGNRTQLLVQAALQRTAPVATVSK